VFLKSAPLKNTITRTLLEKTCKVSRSLRGEPSTEGGERGFQGRKRGADVENLHMHSGY